MIKTLLIVTVMMGVGQSSTYSHDTSVFDSMDECSAARLIEAQSLFPRSWLTKQTESVWEAKNPVYLG